MKRKPNFGTTVYYVVSENLKEDQDPVWLTEHANELVEEEYLEEFKATILHNFGFLPDFKFERFEKQNRQYMKENVFGWPFNDYNTAFIDQDCPECEHLLFTVNDEPGSICTNYQCKYVTKERMEYQKKKDDEWEALRNAPPLPQFREEGQTLEEFRKKYKFSVSSDDERLCVRCK